ncbi:MAG: hypothetical protein JXB39_02250 [Deltaproteobacteria bacterium]|nr:hypothetical protein [Deltaproteobacteria bacterium]
MLPAHRIHIPDLCTSDPVHLGIRVPELLRRGLAYLSGSTLAGLFALSEGPAGLPRPLAVDLDAFARARERELCDLPDGDVLQAVLSDLASLPPGRVPTRLRRAVEGRGSKDGDSPATAALLDRLEATWATALPDPVLLPGPPPPPPPASPSGAPVVQRTPRAPTPPRPPRPSPPRDERRGEWIREYVLARLDAHREQGLKESLLVAGSLRTSPWDDIEEAEVIAALRALRHSGEIRSSSGRWIRVKPLGW